MSQRGRNAVALTVAGAVFVAVFAIPMLVYQLLRPSFAGDPSAYASLRPGPEATGAPAVMKLGLVVVDTATGRMDPVWGSIPEGMQATSPTEVGTVVQLAWGESLSGHYDDNPSWPAYSSTVAVTVVDAASRAVIAKTSFTNAPPATRPDGAAGDTVAARPEDQVVTYLVGLPSPPAPLPAGMAWFLLFVAAWVVLWCVLPLSGLLVRARRASPRARAAARPRRP